LHQTITLGSDVPRVNQFLKLKIKTITGSLEGRGNILWDVTKYRRQNRKMVQKLGEMQDQGKI
jgi:hypothetical protein